MLLSPAVLALLSSSVVVCGVAAAATFGGGAAALGWDPDDSGPRQLAREHRMLLAETALKVALGCQLASLLVFVATVDRLHPLFTGAMCAAGTLAASRFGYPTLGVKLAVFLLCGLWLVTHHATRAAAATSVVRLKALALIPILGALIAESTLQILYFADLDPEILTSCCATIFSREAGGLGGSLVTLPAAASQASFFTLLALTLAAGLGFLTRHRAMPALFAGLFTALALLLGAASMVAVVSWVAPGFYQLPTHHCPFCLLGRELGYIGYPLYALLAIAVIAGAGTGLVHGLRSLDRSGSLRPAEERRLCLTSMAGFALFSLFAVWPMVASRLGMEGS